MATARMIVETCPCGQLHEMTVDEWASFSQVLLAIRKSTIVIPDNWGRFYRVPAIYLACHGLRGGTLPTEAALYGFKKVSKA